MIKRIIKKILFRERSSSEAYVKFLRKHGCKIGDRVFFYSPRLTTIDDARMDWISIGSNTKITQGVVILAHDYSPSVFLHANHRMLLAGGKYTTVGSNCFLGINCIILPGCNVGNNCIIGAGAVVCTDIPDNSVVAGNPAKIIKRIEESCENHSNAYLGDAKRNVKHFKQSQRRLPEIKELHGFAFLFLRRSEKNWSKYFTDYLCHDNDRNDIRSAFFETKPIFESYDDFIKFCLNNEGE